MFGEQVEFFAVAVAVNQNQSTIRRYLERQPYPFPVLWDDRGRALRSYHVPGTSYVVLLDARGRVVYTGAGPDQDLLEAVAAVVTSEPLGR